MTDRTCHRTVLALPWLLNGSLEAVERRAVREHLIACAACRAELVRTREVLAAVQAGRQATSAEPAATAVSAGRVAAFRRAATGRLTTHRLAWAAMVAALVISAGNVWMAVRRAERQVMAEAARANAAPAQATQATAPRPAPEPVTAPAPALVATVSAPPPATRQPAFEAPKAPRATFKASPSTSRPAPAETISATDFERGSLAGFDTATFDTASFDTATPPGSPARARLAPQPSSSSIFSGDFENGDLGEWQKETSPRGESTR